MRNDHRIRIFPEYFDKQLTKKMGRRLPLKNSLENPSLNELKIASQKLGFTVDTFNEKAYPRSSSHNGLILLSTESGGKIDLKKGILLRNLSKTVTEYARPKILEYVKQKEQQANTSKNKPGKNTTRKPEKRSDKKQKPSRRRR